jgi:hypothetical protein
MKQTFGPSSASMATQTEACRLASEDVASYVSTDSSNVCALASRQN